MTRPAASASLLFFRACRHHSQPANKNVSQRSLVPRSFSATASQQRKIPAFEQTSNNELNTLLGEIRAKIFIPEIVPDAQRKLIFKTSRHAILLNDPGVFFTTTEGEEIRLMPINLKDRPKKVQTLSKILSLMNETNEWENLPNLLEGLYLSRQGAKKLNWWPMMVRVTIEAGRMDLILSCASRPKETGLLLVEPEVMERIVSGLHDDSIESGFKGEKFDELIANAERLRTILERTAKGYADKHKLLDIRQCPQVVGLFTELYAGKALNSTGEDKAQASKRTLNLAQKLDAVWDNIDKPWHQNEYLDEHENKLRWLIPMWNGTRLALTVDSVAGDPVAKGLRKRLPELERSIQETVTAVREQKGDKSRTVDMYNAVANE